ncbi:hypothetical protein ASG04_16280 [Curtobacterium sp. Leaf183]|nr:hypothetical protein ASG04_16280 [Curtobacterium sp. Leaf183]
MPKNDRSQSQLAWSEVQVGVCDSTLDTGAVLIVKPMPVFCSDDWIALIMLSVTVEPDCDRTDIVNFVPAATPSPHWLSPDPASVQTIVPPFAVQPWLVSRALAFDVLNGYGLSFCVLDT